VTLKQSPYQYITKACEFKTLASGCNLVTGSQGFWDLDQDHAPRSTDQDQQFTFSTFKRNSSWQM